MKPDETDSRRDKTPSEKESYGRGPSVSFDPALVVLSWARTLGRLLTCEADLTTVHSECDSGYIVLRVALCAVLAIGEKGTYVPNQGA